MTLDREKLRQTLAELHAQLDETESLDAELAAQLRVVAAEIASKVDPQAAPPTSNAGDSDEPQTAETSTPERLEDAALQFEQSHPTIAGTVRQLIDMLAQMGI